MFWVQASKMKFFGNLKRQKQKATGYEEEVMRLGVGVSFPGSVAEQIYVSLMLLTLLTEEQGPLSLWWVWLQRPRKVDDVEYVESARQTG